MSRNYFSGSFQDENTNKNAKTPRILIKNV